MVGSSRPTTTDIYTSRCKKTLFAPLSRSRGLRSLRANRLRNGKTVELWRCSGTIQAHWQARLPPIPALNCTFVLNCTSHLCSHCLLLLCPCSCLFIAFLCAYIFLLPSCRFGFFYWLLTETRALFSFHPHVTARVWHKNKRSVYLWNYDAAKSEMATFSRRDRKHFTVGNITQWWQGSQWKTLFLLEGWFFFFFLLVGSIYFGCLNMEPGMRSHSNWTLSRYELINREGWHRILADTSALHVSLCVKATSQHVDR